MDDSLSLLKKYDLAIPRYTSYPTVPYWEPDTLGEKNWLERVKERFVAENGELSIYIHLPFCENLCTFCACNKRITKNHQVETPYIDSLLAEWAIYRKNLPSKPVIREIHLGGGTPTFFSPENLTKLINGIIDGSEVVDGHEFSVEVHPNFSTEEHIKQLALAGFNRISLGVQDFDPVVQFIINRVQPFETTAEVVDWARKNDYKSVNIDLIYGLPKQTIESIEMTVGKVAKLRPNRIAFYSYAHVPWKSKGQRRYTDEDVPKADQKWAMYQRGRELLTEAGYKAIGMDHFALPEDKLFEAAAKGDMHRNFMGYTTTNNKLIIGLGASSIGDSWEAFAQNEKEVEAYQEKVATGHLPLVNGHQLNEEDLYIRQQILNLMCIGETVLDASLFEAKHFEMLKERMQAFSGDRLLDFDGSKISVLPKGDLFIRNISSVLDARLWRKQAEGNLFSKSI